MATTFVLIVLLITTTPRPAFVTAEFENLERCEAAGKSAEQKFGGRYNDRVYYLCAKK